MDTHNDCCEKCIYHRNGRGHVPDMDLPCISKSCPCHTPVSEDCENCYMFHVPLNKAWCKCDCHTPPPTETQKYYSKIDGNVFTLYDIETNKKVGWFDGTWHSPTVEPKKADWYVCAQCGEGFATKHTCPKRCHHLARIAGNQGSICRSCGEVIVDTVGPTDLNDVAIAMVDEVATAIKKVTSPTEWGNSTIHQILLPCELVPDLEAQVTNQIKDLITQALAEQKARMVEVVEENKHEAIGVDGIRTVVVDAETIIKALSK